MTSSYVLEKAALDSLRRVIDEEQITADMLTHMWEEAEGLLDASNDQSMQWREALYNLAARLGLPTEKIIVFLCMR